MLIIDLALINDFELCRPREDRVSRSPRSGHEAAAGCDAAVMDRRGFVRAASALAAGGAMGSALTACGGSSGAGHTQSSGAPAPSGGSSGSTAKASSAATPRAAASAADWTALGRGLAGHLVRPGDSDYGTARLLFRELRTVKGSNTTWRYRD